MKLPTFSFNSKSPRLHISIYSMSHTSVLFDKIVHGKDVKEGSSSIPQENSFFGT